MLPRAARLLNRRDFRAAYSRSQSYSTSRLVLYVRTRRRMPPAEAASFGPLRIGFSISKKTCRKAHDRNLLKRRLREISRSDVLPYIRQGSPLDTIVVARTAVAEADFATIRADLCQLFRKAGILSRTEEVTAE